MSSWIYSYSTKPPGGTESRRKLKASTQNCMWPTCFIRTLRISVHPCAGNHPASPTYGVGYSNYPTHKRASLFFTHAVAGSVFVPSRRCQRGLYLSCNPLQSHAGCLSQSLHLSVPKGKNGIISCSWGELSAGVKWAGFLHLLDSARAGVPIPLNLSNENNHQSLSQGWSCGWRALFCACNSSLQLITEVTLFVSPLSFHSQLWDNKRNAVSSGIHFQLVTGRSLLQLPRNG